MPSRVTIASVDDVQPGERTFVTVDDTGIALFNVDGELYAIENRCPHQGGSLGKGDLNGCVVACPWHQSEYDVTTGNPIDRPQPASKPIECYNVIIDGQDVQIEL